MWHGVLSDAAIWLPMRTNALPNILKKKRPNKLNCCWHYSACITSACNVKKKKQWQPVWPNGIIGKTATVQFLLRYSCGLDRKEMPRYMSTSIISPWCLRLFSLRCIVGGGSVGGGSWEGGSINDEFACFKYVYELTKDPYIALQFGW